MKLKDVLCISTKNMRIYFKRNIITMMVMGVTFGLVFAINLWLQGVVDNYQEYAGKKTDGKVVIMADNLIDEVSSGAASASSRLARSEMIKDIEDCGGIVLGDAVFYGAYGGVMLPQNIMQKAIEIDINEAPADAAPTLVTNFLGEQLIKNDHIGQQYKTAAMKQIEYEEYRKSLIGKTFTDMNGAKYFIVGMAADSFQVSNLSFKQLEQDNDDALNYILRNIRTIKGRPIVIDNGKSANWQTGNDVVGDIEGDMILAVFNNNDDVYNYFRNGKAKFPNTDIGKWSYNASVVAGMSPEEIYILKAMKVIANIISVVFAVVAAVVVIFTSIRLVDYDRKNISLYYSLGATQRQIKIIYFWYFVELMIGALIFAFGVALLAVILYSTVNKYLLSVQSELAFSLLEAPKVVWCGINGSTFIIMAVMLSLAGICVLANNKQLNGKMLEKIK